MNRPHSGNVPVRTALSFPRVRAAACSRAPEQSLPVNRARTACTNDSLEFQLLTLLHF